MRKVTVTLDEDTFRWARVRAAELDRSLSRFLGELLSSERQKTNSYQEARTLFFSLTPRPLDRGEAGRYPTREERYDRPGLRRYERPDLP